MRQGDDGCLYYVGRLEDQVKIRGYRVELQEIDKAMRDAAGTAEAVTIAWPVNNGSALGVVAFVCQAGDAEVGRRIIALCKSVLPDYMVPREVRFIDDLPSNANGKVDRRQLMQRLKEGEAQ